MGFERVNRPVGPMSSVFVIQPTTWRPTKTTVLWARSQYEPCAPGFPVHSRWVVCGTSI